MGLSGAGGCQPRPCLTFAPAGQGCPEQVDAVPVLSPDRHHLRGLQQLDTLWPAAPRPLHHSGLGWWNALGCHPILLYPISSHPIMSQPILLHCIPRGPILSHSTLLHPIPSCSVPIPFPSHPTPSPFHPIPKPSHPIPLCPIPSYPIPLPFYSILSHPIPFHSILSYPIPSPSPSHSTLSYPIPPHSPLMAQLSTWLGAGPVQHRLCHPAKGDKA